MRRQPSKERNKNPIFKESGLEEDVSPYDPKFVEKIKKSEKEFAEGKGKKIDIENLWK